LKLSVPGSKVLAFTTLYNNREESFGLEKGLDGLRCHLGYKQTHYSVSLSFAVFSFSSKESLVKTADADSQ
jgi:hypothetical protein